MSRECSVLLDTEVFISTTDIGQQFPPVSTVSIFLFSQHSAIENRIDAPHIFENRKYCSAPSRSLEENVRNNGEFDSAVAA